MKINGIEISIQKMEIKEVDETLIMCDPISKNVIVLNKTASFIWNIIAEPKRTNDNINTCDIVDKISQKYNMSKIDQTKIHDDVEEIFKNFFEIKLK